jgi:hypothetical protein
MSATVTLAARAGHRQHTPLAVPAHPCRRGNAAASVLRTVLACGLLGYLSKTTASTKAHRLPPSHGEEPPYFFFAM